MNPIRKVLLKCDNHRVIADLVLKQSPVHRTLASGTGLAFAGIASWLTSRRDPKDRYWPLPDTILIVIAGVLMLLGVILACRSFW